MVFETVPLQHGLITTKAGWVQRLQDGERQQKELAAAAVINTHTKARKPHVKALADAEAVLKKARDVHADTLRLVAELPAVDAAIDGGGDMSKLSVAQLKVYIKARGGAITGKKEVLVATARSLADAPVRCDAEVAAATASAAEAQRAAAAQRLEAWDLLNPAPAPQPNPHRPGNAQAIVLRLGLGAPSFFSTRGEQEIPAPSPRAPSTPTAIRGGVW